MSQFRALLGFFALILLTALASPAARAAIVTGAWDPALPNPPFDNLGWTATINVSVDDRCILTDGSTGGDTTYTMLGRTFACDSSLGNGNWPFTLLQAEVGIYDLDTLLIVDVLRFDPASFQHVYVELDEGGVIAYMLSLTDSNALFGHVERTQGFEFKLDLPGAAPALKYREGGNGEYITPSEVPLETAFAVHADEDRDQVLRDTRLEVGQAIFTAPTQQVPEPGSLALTALGLGAAMCGSRRRRAAGAQTARS